jgi:DNA-directed RNA polymerase specialized sigma subunit
VTDLYRPAEREATILELKPWIVGFVQKEYGHVDPQDQEDIVQEGCLALIQIVGKLDEAPPRFRSAEEYVFYVKAVVRNSIRDYILKLRSKFDISLYKLRRQLRCDCPNRPKYHLESCTKTELGNFMSAVGDEFAEAHGEEEAEDPHDWEKRQRRLSLLSNIRKSGRGMKQEECQEILGSVLEEYKQHLAEDGNWNFQPPTARIAALSPNQVKAPASNLPHARTPVASTAISAERVVKCANRFCETDLRTVKLPVVYRGYGYCSKSCRKEWPPVVIRLQSHYKAPIEVILEVALKLFRSKRRTAELLNIAGSTMERLVGRFGIQEIAK